MARPSNSECKDKGKLHKACLALLSSKEVTFGSEGDAGRVVRPIVHNDRAFGACDGCLNRLLCLHGVDNTGEPFLSKSA